MTKEVLFLGLLLASVFAEHTTLTKSPIVIDLINFYNNQYYGPISLGSPSQLLNVQFSTSTVGSWIPSAYCTSPFCFYHNSYDPDMSETSNTYDSVVFNNIIGGKIVEGVFASDTVVFSRSLKVSKFYFGLATSVSGYPLQQALFDGIIGMGTNTYYVVNKPTLIEEMQLQGLVDNCVFSFYYTKNGGPGSKLILGGLDQTLYTGPLTTHTVSSITTFWQLNLSKAYIGNILVKDTTSNVIIDTATSGIIFPTIMMNQIKKYVWVASNCSNYDSLQDLNFMIDGYKYTVTPKDYVIVAESGGSKSCNSSISTADYTDSFNMIILGNAFNKAYYAYFDVDNLQVSFAKAV